MSDLYLSRATLRRDAATGTLASLLDPVSSDTLSAHHKLLWSLFADDHERQRDFLWRTESRGQFMLLSRRSPVDTHALFELETQEFSPVLSVGDQLRFTMRVNAVVSRWKEVGTGKKRVRHDIVMDALQKTDLNHSLGTKRSEIRDEQAQQAAQRWMVDQGKRCGFTVEQVVVNSYQTQRVPRRNPPDARFGVLDLQGVLTVNEDDLFLRSMAQGFGKGKAFGNGLMLIKRF